MNARCLWVVLVLCALFGVGCSPGECETVPGSDKSCASDDEDYLCSNGEVVAASWACDGEADCSDGTDETNCEDLEDAFVCDDGERISDSWVCDGDEDCSDGEDELGCEDDRFQCDDGERISDSWVCDGDEDCSDGEDELDCGGEPGDSCEPTEVIDNSVPRDDDGDGEITQQDVCVPGVGVIESITLRYGFTSYFGEPLQRAVFAYEADFSIGDASWIAQVFSTDGTAITVNGRPLYVGWEEGSWPDPGGEFGSDSPGSPWWGEVFGFYDGGTYIDEYVDEDTAKSIYQGGFTLDRLQILSVDGDNVSY